ncbi:MAG TPA: hypothetical protein VF677_00465, partial [Flavobacterium sp.]
EKHGIKMKSYVAVQKKLLVLIYHIWKKNEQYDSSYIEKRNKFPEDTSTTLTKKSSPNQVEATPDKQCIFENEMLSIV